MKTDLIIGGKLVILTPTGIKLGSKGKVVPAGTFFRSLGKSLARKARKAARAAGFLAHAAA